MAYITYQQYVELYGMPPITEVEFPMYANVASDVIDSITGYKILQGGLSALPSWVQTLIQKATAAQIMYFVQNGIEAVTSGQTGQGFTAGKVSVDSGNSTGLTAAQLIVSPMSRAYLEQTGLMERSVPCLDQFRPSFFGIV